MNPLNIKTKVFSAFGCTTIVALCTATILYHDPKILAKIFLPPKNLGIENFTPQKSFAHLSHFISGAYPPPPPPPPSPGQRIDKISDSCFAACFILNTLCTSHFYMILFIMAEPLFTAQHQALTVLSKNLPERSD